jgi:hypothetical protein
VTTNPPGINSAGEIAGNAKHASGVVEGFLRSESFGIVTFEAPGAGTTDGQGTFPTCINSSSVAGYYMDGSWVSHGFIATE